jgi:hypothetical protein
VLTINAAIGISTIIPIGISGLFYTITTVSPIIYPQSPYQNSFSALIWYLVQKLHGRSFKDRSRDGALTCVNPNMAQGKMQLAMEESKERKLRDVHAVQWLFGNLTEDAEMAFFVMALPGSFNTHWGTEVWEKIFHTTEDDGQSESRIELVVEPAIHMDVSTVLPHNARRPRLRAIGDVVGSIIRRVRPRSTIAHIQGEVVTRELSARVRHLFETCKHQGPFVDNELRRKHTRACIETAALLVCYADAKVDWFGDILKPLGDMGHDETTRMSSLEGNDKFFVMRWTCLSLMAIRPVLESYWLRDEEGAKLVAVLLEIEDNDNAGHGQPLTHAAYIDATFERACGSLEELYFALADQGKVTEDRTKGILRDYEHQISVLKDISDEADTHEQVDEWIGLVQSRIRKDSYGIITDHLPGVWFEDVLSDPICFDQTVQWYRDPLQVQFIFPGKNLKNICSLVPTLLDCLKDRWDASAFQKTFKSLEAFMELSGWQQNRNLLQRQVWRLQDLRDGGGLGFTIELFFLALKQLLSTSSSHQTLYIVTFRAITSNWAKYKHSLGTQKVLLDMVASYQGIISDFEYPAYITNELLDLLKSVFTGQGGKHIDHAIEELKLHHDLDGRPGRKEWWAKVTRAITQGSAPSS